MKIKSSSLVIKRKRQIYNKNKDDSLTSEIMILTRVLFSANG